MESLTRKSTDNKILETRLRTAKHVAISFGFERYADDFSQWCALKWTEGFYKKFIISSMFKDFLRTKTGRSTSNDYLIRRSLEVNFHKFEDDISLSGDNPLFERLSLETLLKKLERIDRAIVYCHFKWGMTLKETGEVFGILEVSMGQRVQRILRRLATYQNESEKKHNLTHHASSDTIRTP